MYCAGGDCGSSNLNYCAQCVECGKAYIGKTIQTLRSCISQHRSVILTLGTSISRIEITDENTLAAHAVEHGIRTKTGFNGLYKFFILKYADKERLTITVQNLINSFSTLKSYGLNVANPVGLSRNFRYILRQSVSPGVALYMIVFFLVVIIFFG